MFGISKRPFCVKGGEIIGNVPTIEELAFYIKEYILNDVYSSEWGSDEVKGATRKAIYDMHQTVVGQLEYKGLWDASVGSYPSNPELGWYFVVSVAGEVGGIWYEVGDWIIWNGTSWDKLAGKADVDPIGSQINYFGTGIKGDIPNRDYEISVANGDDFNKRGWFVANGFGGTPECVGRFTRGAAISGTLGGANEAVVVEHGHGASQEAHSHGVKLKSGDGLLSYLEIASNSEAELFVDGYINAKAPAITVNNEGISGVGKNMPAYVDSIPIIRMS